MAGSTAGTKKSSADGRRRWLGWECWYALLAVLVPGSACARPAEIVGRIAGGDFVHLAAAGDRLLANDGAAFHLFDVSDPRQPRWLARLESPEVLGAMAFVDGVAYAEVGVRFRNLETEASSVDQQWIERGWLKIDERSYSQGVFVGVSNLVRLDLADPERPVVVPVANLTPPDTLASRLRRMVVDGRYLFASEDPMGSRIFDVSDPRKPILLATLPRGQALAPAGNRLYVADGAGVIVSDETGREVFPGGLQVLDLTDPSAPRAIGRLDSEALGSGGEGANVDRVAVRGHHVYLGLAVVKGGGWGGVDEFLVTVDAGDPARPREVGREKLAAGIGDLAVAGATLYARLDSRKLLVYDLADPARPRRSRSLSLPGEVLTSLIREPYVYVGHYGGLSILELKP